MIPERDDQALLPSDQAAVLLIVLHEWQQQLRWRALSDEPRYDNPALLKPLAWLCFEKLRTEGFRIAVQATLNSPETHPDLSIVQSQTINKVYETCVRNKRIANNNGYFASPQITPNGRAAVISYLLENEVQQQRLRASQFNSVSDHLNAAIAASPLGQSVAECVAKHTGLEALDLRNKILGAVAGFLMEHIEYPLYDIHSDNYRMVSKLSLFAKSRALMQD